MSDFLFRRLSEEDREGIKKEAWQIMESFGRKLSKIKNLPKEVDIVRDSGYREEDKVECGNGLKKKILDNAPNKNKDFIIAEKKKW